MHFLHLNERKGLWTWMADAYAAILGFLAVSGLFVLKGKNGLGGRGKWLAGLGVVLPLLALAFLLWWPGDSGPRGEGEGRGGGRGRGQAADPSPERASASSTAAAGSTTPQP